MNQVISAIENQVDIAIQHQNQFQRGVSTSLTPTEMKEEIFNHFRELIRLKNYEGVGAFIKPALRIPLHVDKA